MLNRFKIITLCFIGVAVLFGCSSEEDTIVMAPVPAINNGIVFETEWTDNIGGVEHYFSHLTPAYAYDKIYVASREGVIRAIEPSTGKKVWEANMEGDFSARLSGGLTLSYGAVFVGSENGELIAIDAESGKENWREDVDGEIVTQPLADEGLVIIHTSRGALIAFDADSGKKQWEINSDVPSLTLRGDSSPVSISGGVFWGQANGRLAAALINEGQLLWQQPVATPTGGTEIDRLVDVDSSPLLLGSSLYTVAYNGQLISFDLRSGKPIWKRSYSSSLDLSTDGQRIFLVTDKDHVVAVDSRSGTELWENSELEYRQLTAPVIIDNYLVVADSEGYVHWLDKESGQFIGQQDIGGDGIAVSPIIVEDGFLIITRDGDIRKMQINNQK